MKSEYRPWGFFTTLMSTQKYTVKYLVVNPGEALSLQYHRNRDECWVWVDGAQPRITIGVHTFYMESGKHYTIPRGVKHRIENPIHSDVLADHPGTCTILEVSTGRFDENDIVRLEDNYGRAQ